MSRSWPGLLLYYLNCSHFFSPSTNPKDGPIGGGASGELSRRRPEGWKCMPFIIGTETFERVATYGATANLTVYLLKRFSLSPAAAAAMVNIFSGTANFAPLVGGFIADSYWGRFRTLAYGSIFSLLGMLALTVTAAVPALRPPICKAADQLHGQCSGPSPSHFGFLILSLVFLAAGAGGVRPCSLPFGVDQFDQSAGLGRRDLASFFNWYYCTSTAGVIAGMTAVVYVQDSVGWPLGFAVPAACMLISIVALFMGTRLYVYVSPQGSVFSGVAQVFVASYRKRRLHLPAANDAGRQEAVLYNPPAPSGQRFVRLPLSLQFSFLNKAAIKCEEDAVTESDEPINPWKLCGVQTVEEVKCLLRIAPIWAAGVVFFLAVSQQWTFTVLQSLSMDRRLPLAGVGDLRIPAAAVSVISLISLALFIPVYDRLLVPLLRRATGRDAGVTLLQRQGAGLLLSVVSMAVAGVIEGRRRRPGGREMSAVKWLSPQLVLMGIAEGLNAVGQVEFYNRQFPERMQTVAGSLFYCSIAGGGYLSGALVSIVDKATGGGQRRGWLDKDLDAGRLDYFYYLIAGMGAVNLVYFLVCARFYRYKGEAVLGAIGGEAEGGGRSLMEMGEEEGRGCW